MCSPLRVSMSCIICIVCCVSLTRLWLPSEFISRTMSSTQDINGGGNVSDCVRRNGLLRLCCCSVCVTSVKAWSMV